MLDVKFKSNSRTDEALIGRAARGDLDAFNRLVLAYQDHAYNHAYALLGDPALAEDATQNAFLNAFQAVDRFRGGSFRGWLLKIVTNAAYDILRRSQRHPTQPLYPLDEEGEEMESAPWLADPQASVEESLERKQESERLYTIVNGLPEAYRSILHLIDIDGLDYSEAASILGIPLGTVKSRLARARLQVAKALRREAESTAIPGPVGNHARA